MSPFSPEGMQDSQGANASLLFGDVGKMHALQDELKANNPAAAAAGAAPTMGNPAQAMPGPPPGVMLPPPPAPPPVQPAPDVEQPRMPMTPEMAAQVFSPTPAAPYTWRQSLQVMASHPQAGPYLRRLAELANGG